MTAPSATAWLCGAVVGAVLLVAGASKLAHPRWSDAAPELGVPSVLARPVPWAELAIGAALVAGFGYPVVPAAAAVLCAAFTVLVARVLAVGRRPRCACFGAWSSRAIGPTTVIRNVALTTLAVVATLA